MLSLPVGWIIFYPVVVNSWTIVAPFGLTSNLCFELENIAVFQSLCASYLHIMVKLGVIYFLSTLSFVLPVELLPFLCVEMGC